MTAKKKVEVKVAAKPEVKVAAKPEVKVAAKSKFYAARVTTKEVIYRGDRLRKIGYSFIDKECFDGKYRKEYGTVVPVGDATAKSSGKEKDPLV